MIVDPETSTTWSDILTRRLYRAMQLIHDKERFSDRVGRAVLVAKARWTMLLLIGIYGMCAGSFFYFSRFGIFLSNMQILVLLVSVAAVVCYNLVYHYWYRRIQHLRFVDHIQILLDMVFVTVLTHFSGGAASWFWPVYVVVTIEAAFLMERKRDVWLLGGIGGAIYGALLLAELTEVIPVMPMPFVSTEVHFDRLYLLLMWFWVSFLNATAAVVLTFLMSVIRQETRLLRASEERLLSFIDSAGDLIFSVTADGRLLYTNQEWQTVVGQKGDEVNGRCMSDFVSKEGRQALIAELERTMARQGGDPFETVFITREGREVIAEGTLSCSYSGETPVAVWGIFRDITERKQTQQKLYQLAHYDILTNLPNRALFFDRLKRAKAKAKREKSRMAIMFLDLDRFKIINDTLGHPVGDRLLQAVAERLSTAVREVDTVARIGGDEFIIIAEDLKAAMDAEKVAAKILAALSAPYLIDEHELFVTSSLGISMFPDDDEDLDNLIKKADISMYAAKTRNFNTFKFYDQTMDHNAHKRFVLENSMRRALEKEEFRLHYQPKVDITTGTITAVEALLRWEHPDLGVISPAEFIPLAEEIGLIVPLGDWVITTACAQNQKWQAQGLFHLRVAVNLSGYQLQQKDFISTVRKVLKDTGLAPEYLELEITETVIMQNPDFTIAVLTELRDMGIHISIDDFGTGYSSLSHLRRFSVNTLKIDKSFVEEVAANKTDAAIAKTIISMGNNLNLNVIAEGVETAEQLAFLKGTLCDEIQGYLFSKPLPPEALVEFMKKDYRELLGPLTALQQTSTG